MTNANAVALGKLGGQKTASITTREEYVRRGRMGKAVQMENRKAKHTPRKIKRP